MFKNTPEKFIKASNLIFWVGFLKLSNVIIFDVIPKGTTSLTEVGILLAFVVFGFLMRMGYKWMVFFMPLIMVLPWILTPDHILRVLVQNSLATIITITQIILQLMIVGVLLNMEKSVYPKRGRYAA